MTRLPLDFPPLREAAEAEARALLDGLFVVAENFNIFGPSLTEVCARLLANLDRPASRDFWARWLAARVGLTVGATAPGWQYEYPDPSPRDSDGAPYREDWPAKWALLSPAEMGDWAYFASDDHEGEGDDDWFPEGWRRVAGISDTTDPAAALRLALLSVQP